MANRFVMEQVRREQKRKSPVKAPTGKPAQAQTRIVRPVENTTASAAKSIREELAAARRANPPSRTYLPWEVSSTSAGEDHTEKYTGTLKTLTERLEAGERELTGLKQRYTSAPSEDVRTAYNARLNSYNQDLDTYRTVQKNYDAYQSPQGIQGRVDQLKSRAGELERDRRERSIALQSSAAELETVQGEEAMRRAMEKLRSSYQAYGAVQKDIESVKKRTADLETEGIRRSFEPLRQAADFAEKSVYRSTERGEPKFNALTGTYSDTGFGDITYDYINANERARSRQLVNDMGSQAALLGMDQSFLKELEPDEIALFNYVYAQKGKDSAYQYLKSISGDLTYRQRKKSEAEWAEYAREHPVGTSVFSVLESPMKGLSYLGQAADYLADGQIDQNAAYNKFSHLNSAIRNEVSGIVENRWGKAGSFAYQTGMSMGDFLFNTAITGGNQALSLAIMSSGAAADATVAAKDRGLNDTQSFTLGTVAGLAEILTEKVSLEALLDKTGMDRNAVGYVLKNILAEGSEEVASDLINLTADVLVSRDQSEWAQAAASYQRQGMSKASAYGRAAADQAAQMGLDFLGGAISGGIMAGSGAALGAGLNAYDRGQQRSISKRTGDASNRAYDAMREYGMFSKQARDTTAASLKEMGRAQGYRPGTGSGPQKTFGEAVQEQIMGNRPQTEGEKGPGQSPAPTGTMGQSGGDAPIRGSGPTVGGAQQAQKNSVSGAEAVEIFPGPGLIESSRAKLNRRTADALDRLGKAAGVSVEVVPSMEGLNGLYQNGRVYISADAGKALTDVAKHEITHSFKESAPEQFRAFRDYAVQVRKDDGALEFLQSYFREQAEAAGVELTDEDVLDEIAADYAESLMEDEDAVRKLAGENPGLLRRMADALRAFVQKVKNLFTGVDASTKTAELERGLRLWEDALAAAGQPRTATDAAGQGRTLSDEIARQMGGGSQYSTSYDQENRNFVTENVDPPGGAAQTSRKGW